MLLNTVFLRQLSGSYHNLLLHMILTFYKLCHSDTILKDAVSDADSVFS
jgi:hypothetical protein